MCGFVGEISRDAKVVRSNLYRLNNMLMHRGPDQSAITIPEHRRWGVAHRRLCILDIEGGRQPMIDADRGLTLVYNGEIYDHERLRCELSRKGYCFRTRSDTEVLLALYAVHGLEMFEHLRGEFAFVMVDEPKRRAILVRDRLGLKPLFYTATAEGIRFASEIKALLKAPDAHRAIDPRGLVAAIAVADLPGATVFEGIRQVRHAHYLSVALDTLEMTEHRYWDAYEHRRRDVPSDPADQIALVRSEIDSAIGLRLRADVPVGAYLSGGIDSSLVTATMAGAMDGLDAFALAFDDSPRHNEFPYAQSVAERYPNIRLHRISVTANEMVRRLPQTVWHLERPFGNLHSVAKLISSQYARDYVECVLTGDGGDECFCGYATHWLQDILQRANYSVPAVRSRVRQMWAEAKRIGGNRYYLAGGMAWRMSPAAQGLIQKLGFPPCDLATCLDAEARIRPLLHPDFRSRLEGSVVDPLINQLAATMPPADQVPHATLLQYVQLNGSVPEYISTIADRTEWAGSVEARPPLFDHKVVELAMSLPIEVKVKGDREKHILREAFRDLLPPAVVDRRKQAFLAPPAPFRCAEGRALLSQFASPWAIRDAGIWDPLKVAGLLAARRVMPGNRIINLVLTIILTAQILHAQFVRQRRGFV